MKCEACVVLTLILLLCSCGCTGRGAGTVIVTGHVLDAETGKPVAREGIWIHVFRAGSSSPASAEPDADRSDFAIELDTLGSAAGTAGTIVRLRVADSTRAYETLEREITLTGGALDIDVRLVPTHWLRLHGRVLWRDGTNLRPVRDGSPDVENAQVHIGPHNLWAAGSETYSILVPRELLRPSTVNTNHRVVPHEIDLRGATEAERALDLVLEK